MAIAADRTDALEEAFQEQNVVGVRIGSVGNERAGTVVVT